MGSAGARSGGNWRVMRIGSFSVPSPSRKLLSLRLATGHIVLGQSVQQWDTFPWSQGQRATPLNSTSLLGLRQPMNLSSSWCLCMSWFPLAPPSIAWICITEESVVLLCFCFLSISQSAVGEANCVPGLEERACFALNRCTWGTEQPELVEQSLYDQLIKDPFCFLKGRA